MGGRHSPSSVARPDQIDELHCFAKPVLPEGVEFPLVIDTKFQIHGTHAGVLGHERAVVFAERSTVSAKLDEVAVDEAVEDGSHGFRSRHDGRR